MLKKFAVGILLFCCILIVPSITADAKEYTAKKMQDESVLQEELSVERKEILSVASSLEGKIPYEWGGKPVSSGWNNRWNSYKGLDCSGYVQWVYWTALGIDSGLESTATISKNCRRINRNDLQPGDLGLIFMGGSTEGRVNHVGIYMGDNKWIHCSGGANTVVVESNLTYFKYFVRVDFQETSQEEYEEMIRIAEERIQTLEKMIVNMETDSRAQEEKMRIEIQKLMWESQKKYRDSKKENLTLFGIGMFRKNK